MKQEKPVDQKPNSMPPVVNGPEPSPEKKNNLMEKLLELDLGIHMVVAATLLFLTIFAISWRLNLVGYFQKDKEKASQTNQTQNSAIVADANEQEPVFISNQKISIEKAFKGTPPKIQLTVGGRLKKEVFGFLPYWILEKEELINIRLLTSASFFGLEVDDRGNLSIVDSGGKTPEALLAWQNSPKLDSFIKRAKKNRTKVYLTLKSFDNGNIERLVNSKEASQTFISNALFLMNSKSLDGINIDFEYVGTPSKNTIDNFSILIGDLSREMKREYPGSKLTVDTYIDAASNTRLFDVAVLAQNCDGLVIMGYDFHTPQSSQPGPVAPMEGYGSSMVGFMTSYLEKVPADKLILAVPYYGYDWPVSAQGTNVQVQGGEVKIYPYAEIMDATKNTQISWDENAKTPWYSYKDESGVSRVVHFENTRSLSVKYDLINDKNLQGVGIWALGFDGLRIELLQLIADKFAN